MAAAPAAAAAPPRRVVVGFVNALSGGQLGARVLHAARDAGYDAVFDLSAGGPRCVLQLAPPLSTSPRPPAAAR